MERFKRRQIVMMMAAGAVVACSPSAPASPPAPKAAPPTSAPAAAPAKPAEAPKPAEAAKPAVAVKPAAEAKPAAQPKKGGTLTWGRPHDVLHFDTSQLSQTQEPIFYQLFSTLVRLDSKVQPQPELAESWELSADKRKIQIKLKKGVTFHNGKELTSDDVVATIARYQDEKTAANIRPQIQRFKDPKATDKHTVEISFDAPMATLYDALDMMFIWDKDNFADLKQKPNGTGPFKLAQWSPGESVKLARHTGYHKSGQPYLDEVVIKAYPDVEALVVALETGAIDVANPLRPRDVKRLQAKQTLKVNNGVLGTAVFDVVLNTTRPPFTDKRVRQAISYAIDRPRFVDTFLAGASEPWSLPWPPHSAAWDKDVNATYAKRDVDKAKKLMADAGQASGFDSTILTTRSRAGYPELTEIVQSNLQDIGIRAKIEVQEEAVWRPKFLNGDFDIGTHSFARSTRHPASPFEQAVVWRADKNSASFKNDEYTRLTKEAGAEFDPAKAKAIYAQINKMIIDESFTLVIAPESKIAGMRANVMGFEGNLEEWTILDGAWLDK